MNELSLGSLRIERTMTVKEIAEALGMAEITIRKKAVELFPDCVKNGVATRLTERQVTQLKQSLTPRNLISKYKVDSATTEMYAMAFYEKCRATGRNRSTKARTCTSTAKSRHL